MISRVLSGCPLVPAAHFGLVHQVADLADLDLVELPRRAHLLNEVPHHDDVLRVLVGHLEIGQDDDQLHVASGCRGGTPRYASSSLEAHLEPGPRPSLSAWSEDRVDEEREDQSDQGSGGGEEEVQDAPGQLVRSLLVHSPSSTGSFDPRVSSSFSAASSSSSSVGMRLLSGDGVGGPGLEPGGPFSGQWCTVTWAAYCPSLPGRAPPPSRSGALGVAFTGKPACPEPRGKLACPDAATVRLRRRGCSSRTTRPAAPAPAR
jgi:hypothetical protein